ncbi:MAG: hypothetical protein VYD70_04115 [Planctomycetota bacterium]|nr:hypothetical protein [Planctomycetota bacterium]MEE2882890.1 hypothetical protein [Planctomycetota bacterium]
MTNPDILNLSPKERSLMVVSRKEEHCILYDSTDLPSLLEQLLTMGSEAPETLEEAAHRDEETLSQDHFRAVARELLSRVHSNFR